ncbi:PspC domain-containing protein [Sphingomonas oryzagri]|uniref:PspC domain-containing protein n=1 Tax=Sphingomonas oryzagri TaxID=3042314 RepID=A0ABT6N7I9_9SPHN|nr:PspC domain-containing protein [Sphingomonas oryzagri]MDH7641068.1 PspC domain-containing protein [Sphingomonas oryzagri]
MQDPATAPKDNLFGICHAIGEDFGFNPFWLRVALAIGIIARPEVVLAVYATLGLAVVTSRLLTRRPKAARPTATVTVLAARAEREPLRQAA